MSPRSPTSITVAAAVAFWLAVFASPGAAETAVDLELVLAVDVSGSMDDDELVLQRYGYVAAFRHPEVIDAITTGFIGRIAVTYVEWAGPASQVVVVPWRIVDGAASAQELADILDDAPTAFIRGTSISGGIEFSSRLFDGNGFEGTRQVIDISGDGANRQGVPVETARDNALAKGIVINGLPILLRPSLYRWTGGPGLDDYYEDCVIGGPGAFLIPVTDMDQWARAIRRKLVLEIAGAPARVFLAQLSPPRPKVDCFIGEKLYRSRDYE